MGRVRNLVLRAAVLSAAGAAAGRWIRGMRRDAESRTIALQRRDRILNAVGTGAEGLLRFANGRRLNQYLALVGEATGTSRAYIFRNERIGPGELVASQCHEWVAPGVSPQIRNRVLQRASYAALGMDRWKAILCRGGAILGSTRNFPDPERRLLMSQGIRSIVVLPIFIGPEWWGFIGFDETRHDREWSNAEIDALRTSAGLVAATIARDRIDEQIGEIHRERAEHHAARVAERRSRFLAEASREFGSTLEHEAIFEQFARVAISKLADWAIVDRIEGDVVKRAAVAHTDPADAQLAETVMRSEPPRDPRNPIVRTLEDGAVRVLRRASGGTIADAADSAATDPAMSDVRTIGPRWAMIVPLRSRGRIVAAATMLAPRSQRYRRGDLAAACELATRASLALDNARLYEEARRATRVRDEVLAIVSHDLKNPLHTISLSAGLLEEITPPDAEDSHRQLEIVGRSVQRATRLIDDLLDVARLESGELSLERHMVAVADVVREALELHRAQAEKQGEHLVAVLPRQLPHVLADRDRLLQVFSNLLGNAIKFTPRGGRIELGAEEKDEQIRFWIRDSGAGIPADQLPHVFDPFWQATKRRGGAGLGLAIARGIVEGHGGRIHAESESGVGTTVWFTIPISEVPSSGGSESALGRP